MNIDKARYERSGIIDGLTFEKWNKKCNRNGVPIKMLIIDKHDNWDFVDMLKACGINPYSYFNK
jgi:hypothetical protein